MHVGRTHGSDTACANPISRAHTVNSAPLASMALAANHASVPALGWWMVTVTRTQATASAGQALKGLHVTAVLLATSTSLYASCVVAALWGPCPQAVTRRGAVSAGLSLMALTVTAVALATTATLTAMPAPVTPGALWTSSVGQVGCVAAGLATQAPLAKSVALATMAFLTVLPATAPLMAPCMPPVTPTVVSATAGLV